MIVYANAYSSVSFNEIHFFDRAIFVIKEGVIQEIIEKDASDYKTRLNEYRKREGFFDFSKYVILPGFIDTHHHASQWPQAGLALDRPLETWLHEYTFPLESKFQDAVYAKKIYSSVLKSTLKHGTTTAMYFATVDTDTTLDFMRLSKEVGQRTFIGKVMMDDASNPNYYRDQTTEKATEETKRFLEEGLIISKKDGWSFPVITPRFIPSCTEKGLIALGKLAKAYLVPIQSHVSESDWEDGFVKDLYHESDAKMLDHFGLLTDRTILAHGPFLSKEDVALLIERGSSVSHCPLSNAFFANGVLPYRAFHEAGLNISLGTDISGGYSPSMYAAIRQMVISSRMLETGVDPSIPFEQRGSKGSALTLNNAFYAATVAGAKALKINAGILEVGKSWDVQVVDISDFAIFDSLKPEDVFHKILWLLESKDLISVFVKGKKVYEQ